MAILKLVYTLYAFYFLANASVIQVRGPSGSNQTNLLNFDPLSCSTSKEAQRQWKNLPIYPTQPDDPSSSSIDIVKIDSDPEIAPQAENLSAPPPSGRKLCSQLRQFDFSNEIGWIRTRPVLIDDGDSDYWVVLSTDHPARLKIWQDQGVSTGRWTVMYDRIMMDDSTLMQWRFKGNEWLGKEIMIDISLFEGTGRGTTGSIALFSTYNPPDHQ